MLKRLMNRFKKQEESNEGFTLVEIIVVLVILAVLAAAAIPTMVGFVQDSKVKAYVAEARAVYTACQTKATEYYTSGTTTGSDIELKLLNATGTKAPLALATADGVATDVGKLVDGSVTATVTPTLQNVKVGAKGKVETVVYKITLNSTDYYITITIGGSSEVSTTAPTLD